MKAIQTRRMIALMVQMMPLMALTPKVEVIEEEEKGSSRIFLLYFSSSSFLFIVMKSWGFPPVYYE